MSADAQPNPKQRPSSDGGRPAVGEKNQTIVSLCVVCGDRGCSSLVYGVAACHGCKCFFWRTVKSRLLYTCRYDGHCSMTAAGRNACRFCRFNRCLDAGMKPEAVRMEKKPDKSTKKRKLETDSDSNDENQENIGSPSAKRERQDNRLLASTLLLIDRNASDGRDVKPFNTASYVNNNSSLMEAMLHPEILDYERFEMAWSGSMIADTAACGISERRLFIWALDWTRQAADIEDTLGYEDKVALLRASCAPLSLLELCWHSSKGNAVQLPNGTLLAKDAPLPENCFITNKLIWSLLRWTDRHLHPLELTQRELVLLKALIVLNPDAEGLSMEGERCVAEVRARVTSAMYQFCSDSVGGEQGGRRLSSLLLLLPQLQVMALEMSEQARVRNTFKGGDSFTYQLFGDIFEHDDHLVHSASCSPVSSAGSDHY